MRDAMNGINGIFFAAVVLSGLVLTWFQARAYRKVAADVLKSNKQVAAQASTDAKITAKALSAIHTLVNSNLAAAKQGELDATRRDLASLQEVVSLKEAQGLSVSEESRAVIIEVRARINEMCLAATHATQQTRIADQQGRQ